MKIMGHLYILVSFILGVTILVSANFIAPLQLITSKTSFPPMVLIQTEPALSLAVKLYGLMFIAGVALLGTAWVKRDKAK